MAPVSRRSFPGVGTLLALCTLGAFGWGVERWRRRAATDAGASESVRLDGLARCVLGSDARNLLREPSRARQRLRLLAMASSADANQSDWLSRCVPLASSLVRHAPEVDQTHAFTEAETRLFEATRNAFRIVRNVGFAWRIRMGDPETDVDSLAEALVHARSEIELAGTHAHGSHAAGPVAPEPTALPEGVRVALTGALPTELGTPDRLFLGGPLPGMVELSANGAAWSSSPVDNQPANWWRLSPRGVLRLDAPFEGTEENLLPFALFRPGERPLTVRVSSVSARDLSTASLDLAQADGEPWLGAWIASEGASLLRFPQGADAVRVAIPRGSSAAQEPSGVESVALTSLPAGNGVLVALTERASSNTLRVRILEARRGNSTVEFVPAGSYELPGVFAQLSWLELPQGEARRLLVTSRLRWALLSPTGEPVLNIDGTEEHPLETDAAAHASSTGVLLTGRTHPGARPWVRCDERGLCLQVPPPPGPWLSTLPSYTVRDARGQVQVRASWPVLGVPTTRGLLAARAMGAVVAVRLGTPGGTWSEESVVLDAAFDAHGRTVEGLGLYADGDRATLVVALADGLRILRSADSGATWR